MAVNSGAVPDLLLPPIGLTYEIILWQGWNSNMKKRSIMVRRCKSRNNSEYINWMPTSFHKKGMFDLIRRVWRYQRGNQNPYMEEEQTTQWPKEKVQKDRQRSTKHTYKTKDRVTRTPLKPGFFDKWNISVVICDTDIPSTKSWWGP